MWLYKLTNKANGKAYIGTSVNPISHRVSRHLYAANSGRKDMAIACAIRKYGLEGFEVECLDHAENYEQLLQMEVKAIKEHGTLFPTGYNITEGGRGACRPCSKATRAKISAKAKGRTAWNKGKPMAETARLKMISSKRGKKTGPRGPLPDWHKRKIAMAKKGTTPWNKGKQAGPMSEKQKNQIAETMKQVRATKFWSTRSKGKYDDQTIQ